ncbi:MAG: FecR domain-containing protein [Odoribacter sp.]|nr:FecR domain-containing protein [Odoribacter sp.]
MEQLTDKKSYKIARQIIRLYTDTDLSEEMEREVKAWLMSDAHTEEKKEGLWDIWNNLSHISTSGTNEAWQEVKKKIGVEETPTVYLNRKRFLQAAAVFVPLLFFSTLLYRNFEGNIDVAEEIAYIEKIIFRSEEEAKLIVLEDDTEVQLNKQTELVYRQYRTVDLKGEAAFNVKHKDEQKFIVNSEYLTVTVTGTHFNMQVHPDLEEHVITLYEGTLQVEVNDTVIPMIAGEQLVFNTQLNELDIHIHSLSKPDWLRDYISYNEVVLEKIFRDLEEKYAVRITGGNPNVLYDTITLKLEGKPAIEEVMSNLSQISGRFNYTIENDTVYIY